MTVSGGYSAQRQNPLLYWTTLAYFVGLPNLLHFDSTGRTHVQAQLNLTTLSNMLLYAGAVYVLCLLFLLRQRPLFPRKFRIDVGLWTGLLLVHLIATLLTPSFRETPYSAIAIPVALWLLSTWVLAFFLLCSLYSRTPPEYATDLIVELVGRVAWIWMAMVWIALPLMPGQVYTDGGESAAARAQLGGQFIGPSHLGTLAIVAFFYSLLFFPKGLLRFGGCALSFITLALARTRIEQASFLILITIYALFYSKRFVIRLAVLSFGTAVLSLAVIFRSAILRYVSRGQSAQSLATLDDRTLVWESSFAAIHKRPVIGYGFVVGVKNAIRDNWTHVHWIPPHAHNEYINAWLGGGFLAAIFVACIYLRALWLGARAARYDKRQLLFFLIIILMTVRSIGGPNVTGAFARTGALFLLAFLGIVGETSRTSSRKQAHHLAPEIVRDRQSVVA